MDLDDPQRQLRAADPAWTPTLTPTLSPTLRAAVPWALGPGNMDVSRTRDSALLFGAHLRRLRVRAGLTQEALAERAGLTVDAIGALEQGVRRYPYPHTVRVLIEALHLGAEDGLLLVRAASRPRSAAPLQVEVADLGAEHALAAPLSGLIGREQECEEVGHLVDTWRLVTLVGPGGVGKTRLALAVAAAHAGPSQAIGLAAVRDSALVLPSIAHALGVHETAGKPVRPALVAHLAHRDLLLMLDNLEQVVYIGPEIALLLVDCPSLRILATSRAVLHVSGEHVYQVPPLRAPDDPLLPPECLLQFAAVQLFVDRARAVDARFDLTAENARSVAEICQRLDGQPLAIELAAARVRLLPPPTLLRRLEHHLPLLVGGPRDVPARQQTLRATLAWSHDLLGPVERRLFARLAVFAGDWSLEAAEAVCAGGGVAVGAVLDVLGSLVDQSLVRPTDAPEGELRFGLLATVREYALEQMEAGSEAESVRVAHAAYVDRFADGVIAEVRATGNTDVLVRLASERAELRAALDWLTERGELEAALRLAGAAAWLWVAEGGLTEGRERLARLLAAAPEPTSARTSALLGAAMLAWGQGEYPAQERLAGEALLLARAKADDVAIAEALSALGAAAFQRGAYDDARLLLEEALSLFRASDQRLGITWTLMRLAAVARDRGAFGEAEHLYDEALQLRRAASDRTGVAHILSNLGWLAFYAGDRARARAMQEESLAIRRAGDNPREIAISLMALARVAVADGDQPSARARLREGVPLLLEVGDRWGIALCLETTAGLLVRSDPARALYLAGAAEALRVAIARPLPPAERPIVDAWLEEARRALGAAGSDALAAGAAAPLAAVTEGLDTDLRGPPPD